MEKDLVLLLALVFSGITVVSVIVLIIIEKLKIKIPVKKYKDTSFSEYANQPITKKNVWFVLLALIFILIEVVIISSNRK